MNKHILYDKTQATDIKSTVFADGMVVTADDLKAAMDYPSRLMQPLIRAYFGCGIVCGLEVHRHPRDAKDTLIVKVEPGVALDCHGHPLYLCESVTIDLTPDPCAAEHWPTKVCIAIRRDTVPEAPREDGDDCDDGNHCHYRREHELVRITAFSLKPTKSSDWPKSLCAHPENYAADDNGEHWQCDCLKTCPDLHCCGEAWVLLACVDIELDTCELTVDNSRRKFIKPIECVCKWEEMVKKHEARQEEDIDTLHKAMKTLQQRFKKHEEDQENYIERLEEQLGNRESLLKQKAAKVKGGAVPGKARRKPSEDT